MSSVELHFNKTKKYWKLENIKLALDNNSALALQSFTLYKEDVYQNMLTESNKYMLWVQHSANMRGWQLTADAMCFRRDFMICHHLFLECYSRGPTDRTHLLLKSQSAGSGDVSARNIWWRVDTSVLQISSISCLRYHQNIKAFYSSYPY